MFSKIYISLIFILIYSVCINSYPINPTGNDNNVITLSESSWLSSILVSIGFLILFILFFALCGTNNCCVLFKRPNQNPEVPTSFDNPIAERGLAEINVGALELDPIIFEPLPTLTNLSAQPSVSINNSNSNQRNSKHINDPLNAQEIVCFTNNESNIYAHDWYDERFKNFPRNNIEYVKEIGRGWFGQVIEAEAKDIVPFAPKIKVIVKVLRENASTLESMRFLDESRLYRDSNHGNILKLLGHSIETVPYLLLCEYCPLGDLKSFLIKNVTRAEFMNSSGNIIKMGLDIAKGLEWMANHLFVHGDLAARSCYVGSENRVIIGDYGLSTYIYKDDYYWSGSVAIPIRWVSPESLICTAHTIQTLKVTIESNVWTYGIVLWEICEFGKLPYYQLTDDEVINRVITEKNYTLSKPTMPCLAQGEELYGIISTCLNPNSDERETMENIVKKLENILQIQLAISVSNSEKEFDSKWDQLGKKMSGSKSVNNFKDGSPDGSQPVLLGKRKSVSFLGMDTDKSETSAVENDIKDKNSEDKLLLESSLTKNQSYINEENREKFTDSQTKANNESNCVDLFYQQDPEEVFWQKRIEREEITQKVKSQSFQDLMILTYVEPGDFGEIGDNNNMLLNQHLNTAGSNLNNSGQFLMPNNQLLRKSSSETALNINNNNNTPFNSNNFINNNNNNGSSNPSSQKGIFSNTSSSASSSFNNQKINHNIKDKALILNSNQRLFNSKEIENPFQNHTKKLEPSSNSYLILDSSSFEKSDGKIISPRNFNNKSQKADHLKVSNRPSSTSTPIKMENNNKDFLQNTFDNENDSIFENENKSFNKSDESISPIEKVGKVKSYSSYDIIPGVSTILKFGADDDEFGLKPFQSVKSNSIPKEIIYEEEKHSSDSENQEESSEDDEEEEKDEIQHEALHSDDSESKISIPIPNSSAEFPYSSKDDHINFKLQNVDLNSGTEVSSSSSRKKNLLGESEKTNSKEEDDIDDFWAKQMQSLQEAAGSTKALVQLGLEETLNSPDEERYKLLKNEDKFIEDIDAAMDEMDSLVLHNLETDDEKYQIVKETKPKANELTYTIPKVAFEEKQKPAKFEEKRKAEEALNQSESDIKDWATHLESSINIKKAKDKICDEESPVTPFVLEEISDEEDENYEDICKKFVPSKWNQNLEPQKPSIKSPEQKEEKSCMMKKSVSFEHKKTQLVYEYPCQPSLQNDYEEEVVKKVVEPTTIYNPSLSLDWEMGPDELEEFVEEWVDDDDEEELLDKNISKKKENPIDLYNISGYIENHSPVPLVQNTYEIDSSVNTNTNSDSSGSKIGELRHKKDSLKLDLTTNKGEATFLDNALVTQDFEVKGSSNVKALDSGVGSSNFSSPSNFQQKL